MGLKESVTFFATLSIQLCYDICQTNWIWKQQNSIADDLGHHIGSRGGRCVLEKKREFSLVYSRFSCVRSTTRELATVEHPLWITKVHCCSTDTSEALVKVVDYLKN